MTHREFKLCKAILDVLHNLDGKQADEAIIQFEAQLALDEKIPTAEFRDALILCDSRRWITGVKFRFAGTKYNINDSGESARLEMGAN